MPERFTLPAKPVPAGLDRTLALIAAGPFRLPEHAALHVERKHANLPLWFNRAVTSAVGTPVVWHTLNRFYSRPETTVQTAAHPRGTAGALIHV